MHDSPSQNKRLIVGSISDAPRIGTQATANILFHVNLITVCRRLSSTCGLTNGKFFPAPSETPKQLSRKIISKIAEKNRIRVRCVETFRRPFISHFIYLCRSFSRSSLRLSCVGGKKKALEEDCMYACV
jgi:hypothetical protein